MRRMALREYEVSGQLVDTRTTGGGPGERPGSITVTLNYLKSSDSGHRILFHFGKTNEGAPKIEFNQHAVTQIVSSFHQPESNTSLLQGVLIRSQDTGQEIIENTFPVLFEPIELPGRPPGVVITIGEDDFEGGNLEFTPAQTANLFELFDEYTRGPLDENLSNPILTPTRIFPDGSEQTL